MAMSDCIECWETPCACGHGYREWSDKRLASLIDVLKAELAKKAAAKKRGD